MQDLPCDKECLKILGGILYRNRHQELGLYRREQFAALAGVDVSVVRFIEKGEGEAPPASDIRKVFSVFNFENVDHLSVLDLMIERVAAPSAVSMIPPYISQSPPSRLPRLSHRV